jgi:hypothetical protein
VRADYVTRLEAVVAQLAEALRDQYHNPFGVGQYRQTEAALAAYAALFSDDPEEHQ